METTIYQSNISIFHKSFDLLIISILNNNNNLLNIKEFNLSKNVNQNISLFAPLWQSLEFDLWQGNKIISPRAKE